MNSNEEIVTIANKVLNNLRLTASSCSVIAKTLGTTKEETDIQYQAIMTTSQKMGTVAPYGGLAGSYVDIIKHAHVSPLLSTAEVDKVINVLKSTNRVFQVGTGKGKALIVVKHNAIDVSEYVEKSIDASDAVGLSKALKDAVASIVNENKKLRKQVAELQEDAIVKDRKIQDMASEVSLKHKTSWT